MTNKPELTEGALTPEFIQELYSVAVSCEIAERSGAYMASFDLLCKADDAVGIAHVVRKLIDMVRANDVELQELRRNYLALRGEIEDVRAQLYEAENRNEADAAELRERRKADSAEPVFFIEVEGDDWIQAGRIPGSTFDFNNLPDGINKLYAAPQPAPEREQVRHDYTEDVNSKQSVIIRIYERIYGLLRECPGTDSIYSVAPIEGECIPHGVLAHIGCISFYCNLGHLHIAEPTAFTGCHTHSLSGGTND